MFDVDHLQLFWILKIYFLTKYWSSLILTTTQFVVL